MEELLKELALLLGLPETATADEVKAAVQALIDELKTLREAAGQTASKDPKETAAAISKAMKTLDAIRNELRLASTATLEEMVSAIKGRGEDETALASRLATIETERKQEKATALVARFQGEGKLVAANLDWANEQALANPEAFEKLMASAPVIVKPGAAPRLPIDPALLSEEPTEADKWYASQTGQDAKVVAKNRVARASKQPQQ